MFDLPAHSAFVAELFSRKAEERQPALFEHLAACLPQSGAASRPAPLSGKRLAALAMRLVPCVEAAQAFLEQAAKNKKGENARSPLFFELAASLEGARDAAQAVDRSCRETVLSMARTQSAAMRKAAGNPKAAERAGHIQTLWKKYEATLGATGPGEGLRAFFRTAGALLSLAAGDEVNARAAAPVAAKVKDCVIEGDCELTVSASLDPRRILARAGAPFPPAKKPQPVHPLETKILEAVDAVSTQPLAPPLRIFLKDLAMNGHILENHAALVREVREKEEELSAARKKYQAAKVRSRKDKMLKVLTAGARKGESFADPGTLRLALASMEEDFESLRSESEMSANRPAVYLKSAAVCLSALMADARTEGAGEARRLGGKEGEKAMLAAFSRMTGPKGAVAPDAPGFWTPALAALSIHIGAASLKKTAKALNERNEKMFKGHFPEISFEIAAGPGAVDFKAFTPPGAGSIFEKSPAELLREIESFGRGLLHSRKEKERTVPLVKRFSGAAALLDAPLSKLSPEQRAKRQTLEKRLPAIKVEMAEGLDGLKSLHRAEMRRAGPSVVIAASEAFFAALGKKYGPDQAARLGKIKETALYARTLAAALPGMNGGDEPPDIVLGEEILLGLENALTDPAMDADAAEAAVRGLFEEARSTLMNMDPAALKQLMKTDPSLSRALNFLAGDAKAK